MRSGLQAFFVLVLGCAAQWAQARPPAEAVAFNSLDGTPLNAWLYRPEQPSRVTVVALHGCGGLYATTGPRKGQLNARHQAMADMLVADGYNVLFPDSLTPRGESEICTQKIGQRRVTQAQRRPDALAALAWAAGQPWADPARLAVLGWSHGGSAVLAATDARHTAVQAQAVRPVVAIAFYPGCSDALKSGYQPATRLALLVGEKDDWTPPGPCIALADQAGAEITLFPDSYHDFDSPVGAVRLRTDVPNGVNPGQGVHVGPNPQARAQANARVRALLREAVGRP